MAYQWNGDDDYVERPANTHLKMTEEFHEAFDIPVARELTFPDTRSGFDFEYKIELNVTREVDLIEIADALADIEYVTHGATLTYGLQERLTTSSARFTGRTWLSLAPTVSRSIVSLTVRS